MKNSIFALLCILCLISSNVFSQNALELKKGIINKTDGTIIKFNSLKQNGTEFIIEEKGSVVVHKFNQNEILSISKKDGDNTVFFGLLIGASGCLGAILGANSAQRDLENQGMTVDPNSKRNIVLTLTGISTAAGVIWGALTPKYAKVYENPNYANRFINHLNLSLCMEEKFQMGIQYKF